MQSFQRFIPVFFLLMTKLLQAQIPPVCTPAQLQGTSACAAACVRCDFGTVLGTTSDNLPAQGGLPPFCGFYDNPEWYRFVAGTPDVTFVLEASNCAQGQGLEMALFESCSSNAPIACIDGANTTLSLTATGLTPGRDYLLVVDGFDGDDCQYTLYPADPAMTTPPAPNSAGTTVSTSDFACAGGDFTYKLSAPVPGATWYTWDAPPGSEINNQTPPVTLPAGSGTSVTVTFGYLNGAIRVVPKNACASGDTISKQVFVASNLNTTMPPLYIPIANAPYYHVLSGSTIPATVGTYLTETWLTSWHGCDSLVMQQVVILPNNGPAKVVVYWDYNNNGSYQGFEPVYPDGAVVSTASGQFVTTGADGRATFANLTNGDTIFAPQPPPGLTVTPAFRIVQHGAPYLTYDFGFYPTPGGFNLKAGVTTTQNFRPGFTTKVNASILNPLGYQGSTTLRVVKPGWLNVLGAMPQPDAVSGDTLIWNAMLGSDHFTAMIEFQTPVNMPLGTNVAILGFFEPVPGDFTTADDSRVLNSLVVGSYDPNDKQVWPPYLLPDDFETPPALEYTIRFQNTGTFPAEFVRLIDTLQESLDPATFAFVASSHPCTWRVYGDGILEFFFENIFLPDSLSDPEGSIGFATFRIRPRGGLDFGEVVENFADIYFDYNTPIRTNTAQTRAVYYISGNEITGQGMRVRPNPAAFHLRCAWTDPTPQDGTLRLISMDGIPRLTETVPAGESTWLVDVQNLDPGLYFAVLEAGSVVYVKQVVVIRAPEVRGWK